MIRIPLPVDGIAVERDLRNDAWRLSLDGAAFTLRPWSWGERRRIVQAASMAGALDRELLVDGVFDLLVEPGPGETRPAPLVVACLLLLGVPESGHAVPLGRAEFLVIQAFGWRPRELDAEPAAAIDALVSQLAPGGTDLPSLEEGWTRVVFAGEPGARQQPEAAPAEEQLEKIMAAVEQWAGVRPRLETARTTGAPPAAPETLPDAASAPSDSAAPADNAPPQAEASSGRDERPGEPGATTIRGTARLRRAPGRAPTPAPPAVRTTAPRPVEPRPAPPPVRATATAPWPVEPRLAPPALVPGAHEAPRAAMPALAGTDPPPASKREPNFPQERQPLRPVPAAAPLEPRPVRTGDWLVEPRRQEAPVSLPERPHEAAPLLPWPSADAPGAAAERTTAQPEIEMPPNPFRAGQLEEEMADVLDRAAREAGVDLP